MCIYKILSRTKNGYIILCNECNHYQLAFGTTGVSFEMDDFIAFCNYVIALKDAVTNNGFETGKRIKVNLFCNSAMMILNYMELNSLFELVCEAKFNIEVHDLFTELNVITQ